VALGEEHGQPPASDMRKLVWDEELAMSAQRWADQCHFGHDRVRDLCDGTYVGQNVFISYSSSENTEDRALLDFKLAVGRWHSEVQRPGFDAATISPFKLVTNTDLKSSSLDIVLHL